MHCSPYFRGRRFRPHTTCVPSSHSTRKNLHPRLTVGEKDAILAVDGYGSGSQELWNLIRNRGIRRLLNAGQATNWCVLTYTTGMHHFAHLGLYAHAPLEVTLVRDLNWAMTYDGYNPLTKQLDPDFTSALGTQYSIGWIEQHVGSTTTRDQILRTVDRTPPPAAPDPISGGTGLD